MHRIHQEQVASLCKMFWMFIMGLEMFDINVTLIDQKMPIVELAIDRRLF
jgi:hypothetical protein